MDGAPAPFTTVDDGGMAPTSPALSAAGFLELRDAQAMVLGRGQLTGLDIHRQLVSRRVKAGLWQAVGPHVVVLHPGPLTRRQQHWVGVLHSGPGAVLSGLTALEVEGFTGFTSPDVITLAPHGRGRRDLATEVVTVRVRERVRIPAGELLTRRSPPRLRQEPAAVLAASGAQSDRACRTILAMVVQQRLAAPAALRALVEQRPRLARRALILETIDDVEGGSQSLPELEYLAGLRRFRLPMPSRQARVQRPDGRYLLDAEFDEFLVTVEINGIQHLTMAQKEWDDMRRTRLAIGGRLVVDIGSYAVRHDVVLAVLLTADALFSRGWVPPSAVRRGLLGWAARHPAFAWTSDVAA